MCDQTVAEDRRILIEMVSRWRKDHDDLRFGQWLWAVCGGDPFHVEDDLSEKIDRWFDEYDRKG